MISYGLIAIAEDLPNQRWNKKYISEEMKLVSLRYAALAIKSKLSLFSDFKMHTQDMYFCKSYLDHYELHYYSAKSSAMGTSCQYKL